MKISERSLCERSSSVTTVFSLRRCAFLSVTCCTNSEAFFLFALPPPPETFCCSSRFKISSLRFCFCLESSLPLLVSSRTRSSSRFSASLNTLSSWDLTPPSILLIVSRCLSSSSSCCEYSCSSIYCKTFRCSSDPGSTHRSRPNSSLIRIFFPGSVALTGVSSFSSSQSQQDRKILYCHF